MNIYIKRLLIGDYLSSQKFLRAKKFNLSNFSFNKKFFVIQFANPQVIHAQEEVPDERPTFETLQWQLGDYFIEHQ